MIYNHSLKARAVCAIALTTCLLLGPQVLMADAPKPEAPAADSTRVGTLQTSAGVYTFTPRSCLIHIEDGVPDIEIQGPGIAPVRKWISGGRVPARRWARRPGRWRWLRPAPR